MGGEKVAEVRESKERKGEEVGEMRVGQVRAKRREDGAEI